MRKHFAVLVLILGMYSFPLTTSADTNCTTFLLNGQSNEMCIVSQTVTQPDIPTMSAADGFSRQGITGCNSASAYAMSVGSMGATGGVYVPVSDAAVTLNTGYLVYKECIIKEVIAQEKKVATANTVKETTRQFTTGRAGNPYFPVNLNSDRVGRGDEVFLNAIRNGRLNALSPAFLNDVTREIARNYYSQTRNSSDSLKCSYSGSTEQLRSILSGQGTDPIRDVLVLTDPNCIPLYAFSNAQNLMFSDIAADQQEMLTRLGWSNGIYGKEQVDAQGNRKTDTPGIFVQENMSQKLQSGFRQQENASDIGQLVGSVFANIGVQLITEAGNGLMGLMQGSASSPAYLDRVTTETSSGLRESMINATLQNLLAPRAVELAIFTELNNAVSFLIQQMGRARAEELACWNSIVPKVKTYTAATNCARNSDGTETCASNNGGSIRIATTTAASDAVISAQIAGPASRVSANRTTSQQTLTSLDRLITGVANSTSATPIQQVDALVAGNSFHNQNGLASLRGDIQSLKTAVSGNVDDAIENWKTSTEQASITTSLGWCAVDAPTNATGGSAQTTPPAVIYWANRWRTAQ